MAHWTSNAVRPHIVIIGAGIIGASMAFHLSLRRMTVTVLDQGTSGNGATHASFAWINARDKTPRGYHELNRRSMDLWPRFERRLGQDIGLRWGGEVRWAATQDGAREFTARVRELQSWGYPIRLLTRQEFETLEPGIQPGEFHAGSYSEGDGIVDAVSTTRVALTRAAEMGATMRHASKVAGLALARTARGTTVQGVALESGEIVPCDLAVLAAGTGGSAIAATAGLNLPQTPTAGATVLTSPVSPLFHTVCALHTPRDLPETLLNVRQFTNGAVMIHGGTHGGSTGDRSREDADRLLKAAAAYLPGLEGAQVVEIRRAMRPMPTGWLSRVGILGIRP